MILLNRIQCPDGTILTSRHRHDFQSHIQEDGRYYAVDGGLSYQRVLFSDNEFINLSITSEDDFEKIRENMEWGTYGKDGKSPLKYKKLKDLDSDHIFSILETQKQLSQETREIFRRELNNRFFGVQKITSPTAQIFKLKSIETDNGK